MNFNQVTIKDIARELGISPSTVSRALKDHPDISVETKKAVHALAEKLNYQPNTVALNLRQRKTNTIGVIIPEIVHFFFSTVISGIEDIAYQAGYNVILAQSNESYQREVTDMKALYNSRVDGMLLSLSRETENFDHIESIIAKGVPLVFYDRMYNSPNCSKVIVDDYTGAKEAVQHMIDQDCKKIAHLMAAPNLAISIDRLKGYEDALRENKMEPNPEWIVECRSGTFEEGKRATKKLLSMPNPPDSIFANNDPMAMGAMMAIKEKGLKIPQDVALVGFSNWFFGQLLEPPLTTVDQPGFEMGQEAARILIKQIEMKEKNKGEPVHETKTLKAKLIVRASSLKKDSLKK
ncbi:MAG TPA: LacI family transcriptional regulator [Cytophagales bacterium]|jgi:LacI family transcriptional regulator|nr:LacI family transcriptional regulator [Cytophagales bacterium]